MHASTFAIALFAATQAALAAPTPANNANNARSLSAIGDAIGKFAEEVVGPHIGRRDVDQRSLSAIENFIHNLKRAELGARSLSAIGDAIGDFGPTTAKRSLKAVGAAVAGGVASGVAGAIGNAVLNNKRSDVMVDTDTGIIYMDVPDANEGRSLKAVGAAVAGGVASGAVGAIANDVLGNNKRSLSAIENFFSNLKRDNSAQAINHQIKQVLQRSIDGDLSDVPVVPTLIIPPKRSELE